MAIWRHCDLKKEPCYIPMYNEKKLKKFMAQNVQNKQRLSIEKEYVQPPGWKNSTWQGIRTLAELYNKARKKMLYRYYKQNGVKEAADKQKIPDPRVTTYNVFVGMERKKVCRDVISGKETMLCLPTRVNKHTINGMYTLSIENPDII